MHSNIQYLLNRIKREIPAPILHYCFLPNNNFNVLAPTIDWCIRDQIIDKWLLVDCNLMSGQEVTFDLSSVIARNTMGGYVLEVPQTVTAGRNITAVLSVEYSYSSYITQMASNEVADAAIGPIQIGTGRVQLVGPNTIYVTGSIYSTIRFLRCRVENESNFGNIKPASLTLLAKMAVLAAKSHIYNTCHIAMEQSPILNGVAYGIIAEMVAEYSDSNEMYLELLSKDWPRVSLLNDPESHTRLIRLQIPK